MPNAPVINNPYVLVNDERRTATLVKNRGRVLNELLHDHETLVKKLGDTLTEMGDTFDLNKITSITGGAGDKVEAIINMHSDLAGFDGAIAEIRAIEAAQSKARDGGLDNYLEAHGLTIDGSQLPSPFNPYGDRHVDAATQIIMDAQRRGLHLRQAEAAVQTYEVDMVKANIFATLFRRGASEGDATSGWPTEVLRMPGMLIDSIQRPVQVTDLFNVIRTTQSAVKYMQETTFDNNVTEIAEATLAANNPVPSAYTAAQGWYPESALKVIEQTENIYKIGTHIPVTQEQLDDVAFVRAYLNRRIPFMMRQTIDGRLLGSDSASPAVGQIIGLLHRNIVRRKHKDAVAFAREGGADTIADGARVTLANFSKPLNTLLQAKANVMWIAYGMPSHCIMHPNIWVIMATQESASGGYYLGNPANEFSPRVWGMPIVQAQTGVSDISSKGDQSASDGVRYGAVVGDFNNWTDLVVRKDMEVQVGVINVDFLLDVLRIKASARLGLLLYRPEAFVAIENPRSV